MESLQPIKPLSSTGEVAEFVDDNQFGSGSLMKCGYEIVAMFWHSTKPGTHNPYSSSQVHSMAHADYEHFAGADIMSNQNGMTNQQLYDDLAMHNFHYVKLPLDWNVIRAWLAYGYPVIVGGVRESTVIDLELRHCPYSWIGPGKADYWHIIMATGLDGPESLKFRDTANIGPSGVRPGPRRYSTQGMAFTTATLCVPSWLPVPPAAFDPTKPIPSPPVAAPPPEHAPDLAAIRADLEAIQAKIADMLKAIA